jgi:hypothetical protein
MVTIVRFAPEHERRLRRLCVKNQFLRNIASRGTDVEAFALRSIALEWDWADLVYNAFVWEDSPEGHTYWDGIANLKTRSPKCKQ